MTEIKHVIQEERYGCVLACIAMITGETYSQVKNEFSWQKGLGSETGMSVEFFGTGYLFEKHGYLNQVKYPTISYNQQKRENWIEPFAPLHIVVVETNRVEGTHAVVMDASGNIKDPARGDVYYKLSDYQVLHIVGFWKIPAAAPEQEKCPVCRAYPCSSACPSQYCM